MPRSHYLKPCPKLCWHDAAPGGCINSQCKFFHEYEPSTQSNNFPPCIPQRCIGPKCRFYHENTNRNEDEYYQDSMDYQGTKRPHEDNVYGEKRARTDFDVDEIVLVPDKYVGLLLGENGIELNRTQITSGACINIKKSVVEGDKRKVTISGSQEQVDKAKRKMNTIFKRNNVYDFKGFWVEPKQKSCSRISTNHNLNAPGPSKPNDGDSVESNFQFRETSGPPCTECAKKIPIMLFGKLEKKDKINKAIRKQCVKENHCFDHGGTPDCIKTEACKKRLENRVDKLSAFGMMKKVANEKRNLKETCESQQRQIESLTRKLAGSDSLKQCALQETDQLTKELTNLKAHLAGDVEHLKVEKSDLVDRLEQSIGDLENDNERARTELQKSRAEFQMHVLTCSSIESERDNLDEELMDLRNKFIAVNDQLEECRRKEMMDIEALSAHEQDVNSKDLKINVQDADVHIKGEIIPSMKSDIKQLTTLKDKQLAEIKAKDQTIINLEKKVGHMKSIMDVKAFEMDQLKAEMGRNCKHLDEANHEIKTREEKIHKYLATIKSLQTSDTLRSPKKHKFYKAAQIQGTTVEDERGGQNLN